MKAWTAIDKLSIIWKLDLTNKMKISFFQAAVVTILLYRCTTWTLTKQLEKKLDGNYTRMLRAILNKSWRQHTTKHQLYSHLPPIMKTIQVRQTRSGLNEEKTLHPSSIPSHPSFLCLFWIILSIRSEEVLLIFFMFLIYIKTT